MTVLRHPNNQGVSLQQWRKAAAGGETTLSGTDDFSTALSYTVGAEQVFINGVLLERGVDYAATTGTTITGLAALVAGDIATVASPSAFQVANAIPLSTATTKGDLLAATGASAVTRLGVGADGTTLVADSSTSTGLRYQSNFAAGKNKIINGDFGIWQRGTSFSNPSSLAYLSDRLQIIYDGTGATRTVSRQTFTPGTAPVSGYEGSYFFRLSQTVAGTGGTYQTISQPIEDVRTLAGQTVTLSFWAKADSSRNISANIVQNFGTGGSSDVFAGQPINVNLTTNWVRYSGSITIPSISGKTIGTNSFLRAEIGIPTNTAMTIDIWGWQLEAGSVATAFQTATGTLQGELAACQRYYYRQTTDGNTSGMFTFRGQFYSSGNYSGGIQFPVPMRTIPQAVEAPATSNFVIDDMSASNAMSSIATNAARNTTSFGYLYGSVSSGGTAYRTAQMYANSSSGAYIGWSAEL
jgi:Carbohydrate binding domain